MSKHINSKSFTSKIHQFKNLPEPRNATEAFHSKSYDCFNILDNIDDFNNSNDQNYVDTSKASSILKDDSDKSFNDLQIINSNEGNYGIEIMEQQQIKKHNIKKHNIDIDDEDEIYDDKNFHSEEQDELEITDGKYFSYY
ncbi:unnamed protein product [Rhizophagus irregularis]|uniref:Uncharacterized protein n=1 Tax=Rhizophagus irregularis TaxID=588596 RepID=A0A915YWL6_9GLOM|nr:unnamed protein product [Rhizophagus irregularis]CAB5350369.1 unnamed protein product [Rhizophagus irregularis]